MTAADAKGKTVEYEKYRKGKPDEDPYHDNRIYHMAHLFDSKGNVSPLCAKVPRKLNLKKHELWTIRWEAVTCKKCLALKVCRIPAEETKKEPS